MPCGRNPNCSRKSAGHRSYGVRADRNYGCQNSWTNGAGYPRSSIAREEVGPSLGEESVGTIEWCIGIVPRAYFRPRRYICTAGGAFAAVRPVDWRGAAGTVTDISVNRWRRGRRYLYRRRVIGGRISTEVLPRREFVPTRRSRYYSTAIRGTARHTPFRCDADMSKGVPEVVDKAIDSHPAAVDLGRWGTF